MSNEQTTRIETGPISADERFGLLAAGYIELRSGPDPVTSTLKGGPFRVVDVGDNWIEVAAGSAHESHTDRPDRP